MRIAAATLCALLLALGGFGLTGCGSDDSKQGPGVVEEKTPQPTSGTAGTKAPTPPPSTSTTG
jgi:hypothetical protein